MRKGRSPSVCELGNFRWRSICALRAAPNSLRHSNRAFRVFRTACSLTEGEAALILARFYMSPPANPGWAGSLRDGVGTRQPALIPLLVSSQPDILVNGRSHYSGADFNLTKMFRRLFQKKAPAPLAGAPAGRRRLAQPTPGAFEFVFRISADRKTWAELSVLVDESAIQAWEQAHARELSGTERYAIAKIALFQAFDERPAPAAMREAVRVRNADIEGIVETLGL